VSALNRKLLRDLARMRAQVFTIALVVAAGIMAAISMRGTLQSLIAARAEYYERSRFPHVFAALTRAPNHLAASLGELPGVLAVQTSVKLSAVLTVPGLDRPASALLVSVPETSPPTFNRLHIQAGRYLSAGADNEVLVSARFAQINRLKLGDALEVVLNGRVRTFQIVGFALSPEFIYEIDPAGGFVGDEQLFGILWLSERVLAPAANLSAAFNDVAILLTPEAQEADVIRRVDVLLKPYGGRGAYGRALQPSNRVIEDEIAQNRATADILPLVFLGISAFLLHIVMGRLITLQRPQIAVLKAFGYGDLEIGIHYLLFALGASVLGALLGTVTGIWLGHAYTGLYAQVFRFPNLRFEPVWSVVGGAVGVSMLACLTGAFAAVRSAARLQPAAAMRGNAPIRFRRLLLDRITAARLFTAAQRMILRNLERRPLRAAFAALGVGFALSVLLVGFTLLDSVYAMIDLQYDRLQREDLTVLYADTRNARATSEVHRLDGVLTAEAYRVLPIRLVRGHRSELLTLTGLTAQGQLRPLQTRSGARRTVPDDGIALTDRLALRLAVKPGDRVRLELLDRPGHEYEVRVVSLIDEIIGINAYMELGALSRLLQEAPAVSGAYLRLARGTEAAALRQLRALPAVRGAISKTSMVRSFNEQLTESLLITTTILIGLASVLGVGIIYNGARIALSERGIELATLRVLGFTNGETGWLLLGEQAVLTAVGIPLGWAIGYGVAAIVVGAFDTELHRVPLVMSVQSIAWASVIVLAIAGFAGFLVRHQLVRADPLIVLKTRE
jgi:putative ABC transport system permease protein